MNLVNVVFCSILIDYLGMYGYNGNMSEIKYRHEDLDFLREHIAHHHSVELVGMRRVGINNFLRTFFDMHQFGKTDRQMYIFIDLNNLVEREAFPFWQLTLKRISDAVRDVVSEPKLRREITTIFETAIQYQNLQMTYDGVRESLAALVANDIAPVIFFNRFDRVVNMMSESFIDNIHGLYDASGRQLSCVFTSYRPLADFYGKKLPFDQYYTHYLKPFAEQGMNVSQETRTQLATLSGGHFQYLRLLMDLLRESKLTQDGLNAAALKDERITLLSEELWESLTEEEKKALKESITGGTTTSPYLLNTGMVRDGNFFSPLFKAYVRGKSGAQHGGQAVEFTRKEHILFNVLKENLEMVCERDQIIEKVWPESMEDGISDWSIDKLMERLREKIKKQGLPYRVVTVRTRGYKLVKI
jgi:hypothetical protein